ncbi:MAG TPA: hypothetical protein VLA48_02780 [Nitrososphaeraceae archaeon]|nr:hypothetical protein [Nitrososphaeraceae archaeon]
MRDILQQIKQMFKSGDLFYSASNLLSSPLRVGLIKISENYPNMIISDNGGILAIVEEDGEIIYAKKV